MCAALHTRASRSSGNCPKNPLCSSLNHNSTCSLRRESMCLSKILCPQAATACTTRHGSPPTKKLSAMKMISSSSCSSRSPVIKKLMCVASKTRFPQAATACSTQPGSPPTKKPSATKMSSRNSCLSRSRAIRTTSICLTVKIDLKSPRRCP